MKKLLSIVLAVAMLMSLFCAVPASATELPNNLGTNYVPGEKTGNMINDSWAVGMNYNQHNGSGSGVEVASDDLVSTEGGYRLMAVRNIGHPRALYDSSFVATGEYDYQGCAVSGSEIDFTVPTGKTGNVVFSFQVKTNSESYDGQKVQIGRRRYYLESDDPRGSEYPVEYPGADGGFLLTTEYQTFKGTFAQVEDVTSDNYRDYAIGLPMGMVNGARVIVKTEGAYIGYEYAYDIDVNADETELYTGGSIVVDADILNQIGNVGAFDQSVTWYAMNETRDAAVEGFTFVDGADGTATVSIDSTVATGTYNLVAVADANANLVHGIEVTVVANPYADYVAPTTKQGNLLTVDPVTTTILSPTWYPDAFANEFGTSSEYWWIWTQTVIPENPAFGIGGPQIDKKYIDVSDISGGDTVIISTRVKGDRSQPKVKATMRNNSVVYNPIEYPGAQDGCSITSTTEYVTVNNTFVIPAEWENISTADFYFGFPYAGGTDDADKRVLLEKSSFYVGKEYAHDIAVSAPVTVWNEGETESLAVSASLTNQIGNAYGGAYDITWKAMNTARNEEIDGITVTPGENGAATVTVADTVESGTYDIVAIYGDEVMAKGVSITVNAVDTPAINAISIERTAGGITVKTNIDLPAAKLIFVTYDANGKMTAWNYERTVELNAQGTEEYAIPEGFEAAKVMLWYDMTNCKPLTDVLD